MVEVGIKNLATKLCKIMELTKTIGKSGYNSFQKYHYSTEQDIIEEIKKHLASIGVVLLPSVILEEHRERGKNDFVRVGISFLLVDTESGESLERVFYGTGEDNGDKALYKAYTGAMKYFLSKTFLIASDDDPERDNEVDDRTGKKPTEVNVGKSTEKKQEKVETKKEEHKQTASERFLSQIEHTLAVAKKFFGDNFAGFCDSNAIPAIEKIKALKEDELRALYCTVASLCIVWFNGNENNKIQTKKIDALMKIALTDNDSLKLLKEELDKAILNVKTGDK